MIEVSKIVRKLPAFSLFNYCLRWLFLLYLPYKLIYIWRNHFRVIYSTTQNHSFFPSLCSLRFNNINRKNVISFFPLKSLNNFSPLPHLTGSHLSWRSVKLLPYKSFYIPVRAQYQSMFYMKWTFWLEELFFKATLPTQTWSIWWKCLIAFLRVANNFSFKNFFSSLWC